MDGGREWAAGKEHNQKKADSGEEQVESVGSTRAWLEKLLAAATKQ